MGLFDRLLSFVWGPSHGDAGPPERFRCIKCGEGHDRQYSSCSACGGAFVVPVDEESE
jgi:hypothetical protein